MLLVLDASWATQSLIGIALVKELAALGICHVFADHLAQHVQDGDGLTEHELSKVAHNRRGGAYASKMPFCTPDNPISFWQKATPLLLAQHAQTTDAELSGQRLTLKASSPLVAGLDGPFDYVEACYSFHFMSGRELVRHVQSQTLLSHIAAHMAAWQARPKHAATRRDPGHVTLALTGLAHAQSQSRRELTKALCAQATPLTVASVGSMIDEASVEEALVQIQLVFPTIWITSMKNETLMVEWLLEFIRVVTNLPTKKSSLNLGYCSLVQPLKGSSPSDTFKKMLMEIHLLSEAVAGCIVKKYPCLYDLIRAYRQATDITQAERLLADLQASAQ